MNNRNVIYNGFNLENINNFTIVRVNASAIASRELTMSPLNNADKSVVTSDYYPNKRIEVQGVIRTPEKYLFEQAIRDLMQRLNFREATLQIPNGNQNLEYTATYENIEVDNRQGGFGQVQINFFCSDPFGYSPVYTTALDQASITTNNTSFLSASVDGNDLQLPYISLTLDSFTGSGDITVGNLSTGETIVINETYTAGDIFIIDAENMQVTQNGTQIDFEGKIPSLQVGVNSIYYHDNFSARSVDLIIDYRKRYI